MTESKHTPEQWEDGRDMALREQEDRKAALRAVIDRLEAQNAELATDLARMTSEAIALRAQNAELLEALEFILNDSPEPGEHAVLSVDGYNRACAAIAKAKGGAA